MRIAKNILDLIGQTPMLELNKLNHTDVRILAKLESFNPGGSVKDRIGVSMIEQAEREGGAEAGADRQKWQPTDHVKYSLMRLNGRPARISARVHTSRSPGSAR